MVLMGIQLGLNFKSHDPWKTHKANDVSSDQGKWKQMDILNGKC